MLPFPDFVSSFMGTRARPLDFGFSVRLDAGSPSAAELRSGADAACRRFPKSACVIRNGRWERGTGLSLQEASCASGDERARILRDFMSSEMLPASAPLRQLLLTQREDGSRILLTRMHHALGDGLSLLLWLQAQLANRPDPVSPDEPRLHDHARPVRKTPSSFVGPCNRLRVSRARPSARRAWRTIEFPRLDPGSSGFTYNDLLCAALLATLRAWNGGGKLGLWMPVNVRVSPFEGFGNGSSRIRIYDRAPRGSTFREAAREIRRQVRWAREHGEWWIPSDTSRLRRVPAGLARTLLRWYFRRPWVDMGTVSFSHVERFSSDAGTEALPHAREVESIGCLHSALPLALTAVTFNARTRLTFTWDEALLTDQDMERFLSLFEDARQAACAELASPELTDA